MLIIIGTIIERSGSIITEKAKLKCKIKNKTYIIIIFININR